MKIKLCYLILAGYCWLLKVPSLRSCFFFAQKEEYQDSGLPWWFRRWRSRLQCGRPGFSPWVGKIPWRRAWQPTPVFLPGKFHGERSLVGYSPCSCKESDQTEWLSTAHQDFSSVQFSRSVRDVLKTHCHHTDHFFLAKSSEQTER